MKENICSLCLFIVSVCTMIAYIPQCVKILRTKKTEDISIGSWVIWVVSSTSYLIYSLLIWEFWLVLSSLLEFGLNLLILILTIVYKDRKS